MCTPFEPRVAQGCRPTLTMQCNCEVMKPVDTGNVCVLNAACRGRCFVVTGMVRLPCAPGIGAQSWRLCRLAVAVDVADETDPKAVVRRTTDWQSQQCKCDVMVLICQNWHLLWRSDSRMPGVQRPKAGAGAGLAERARRRQHRLKMDDVPSCTEGIGGGRRDYPLVV